MQNNNTLGVLLIAIPYQINGADARCACVHVCVWAVSVWRCCCAGGGCCGSAGWLPAAGWLWWLCWAGWLLAAVDGCSGTGWLLLLLLLLAVLSDGRGSYTAGTYYYLLLAYLRLVCDRSDLGSIECEWRKISDIIIWVGIAFVVHYSFSSSVTLL